MKVILGVILIFFVSEIVTEEVNHLNSDKLINLLQNFVLGLNIKTDAHSVEKGFNKNKESKITGCNVCKDVVYRMNILSQYSTETETLDMILDKVCYKIAAEFRSDCLDIIKNHRGEIVENFVSGVKTEDICEKMEICKVQQDIDKKKHPQLQCKICVKKVKMLERLVDPKQTAENIQKVFIRTCDILKPEIQKKCVNFYQTMGLKAIQDILKGVKPLKICKDLNLCHGKKELSETIDFMDTVIILANISKANKKCEDCKKMTQKLEQVMDSSKTSDFVIEKLSAICYIFKTPFQAPCQNYFKNPKILQYYKSVLANEDSLKICQDAGVCHKKINTLDFTGRSKELTTDSKKHGYMVCDSCIKAVMSYEIMFNSSSKPEDIQKVYIATCDILNDDAKKRCVNFYEKDGFQAIKDILQGKCPFKICQNIKLCRGKREQLAFTDLDLDVPKMFFDILRKHEMCKHCVKTTWFLERVINSSQTLDFVVQRLSAGCTFYKTTYQDTCRNSLKNPKILAYLKSILAQECPWKICQRIGTCHKKDDPKPDVTAFLSKFNIL